MNNITIFTQLKNITPYQEEIQFLLKYAIIIYGRYQYTVLKNLIIAAAFGSQTIGYIDFGMFVRYTKNRLKVKQMKPSDFFNMKDRLRREETNATCFGINIITILQKLPIQTYYEATAKYSNIPLSKLRVLYE